MEDTLSQKQIDDLIQQFSLTDAKEKQVYEYCEKCKIPTKRAFLQTGSVAIVKILDEDNRVTYKGNFSHQTIICLRCGNKYYFYPKETK